MHKHQQQRVTSGRVWLSAGFKRAPHQPQPKRPSRRRAEFAKTGPGPRIRSPASRTRTRGCPACAECSATRRPASRPLPICSAPNSTLTPSRWPFGFRSADGRSDVQPGRQPRRGDPEQSNLQVPGARHAVWQPAIQRYPVEARALHAVVRGDRTQPDLHHPQRRHHEEIFDGRALRRRGPEDRADGSLSGRSSSATVRGCEAKYQTMPPTPASRSNEADDAPHDRSAGRLISDQWFVRPVLRIANARTPGRLVDAAHAVHQKNALIARSLAGSLSAPCWNCVLRAPIR